MALYSDKVMDHFMNPRNVGKLDNPSGVGQVGNARCGDIMKRGEVLQLRQGLAPTA
jgi:nitrogen fixation protein NifU and related proteins